MVKGWDATAERERLQAERDADVADAKRYRWLRDSKRGADVCALFSREWDDAIDAEMAMEDRHTQSDSVKQTCRNKLGPC